MDIKGYPLPTILAILGALFFLIALLPKLHSKWADIEAKGAAQRVALGLIGALLVSVGIIIYVFQSGGMRPHDHQVTLPEESKAKPAPSDDPCGAPGPTTIDLCINNVTS